MVLVFIGIITFISGEAMFNAYENGKGTKAKVEIPYERVKNEGILFNASDKQTAYIEYRELVYDNYLSIHIKSGHTYKVTFHKGNKQNFLVVSSDIYAQKVINKDRKWVLQKIPSYISKEGFNAVTIAAIRGTGRIKIDHFQTLTKPDLGDEQFNDANIIDFDIKQLEISIKDIDFEKIKQKREEAIAIGVLLSDDEDYVNAKIKADGKTYNTDIRLKGDWTDHLTSRKWSYRIDLDNNECIYGMDKFSIQAPWTRHGIWEYVAYLMYRDQGGVTLRYDFADVFVNGTYYGVYAVEEFMGKRAIENSRKREGPIIRLDEDLLWEHRAKYIPWIEGRDGPLEQIVTYNTTVFTEKKTTESESLSNLASYATSLLNKYKNGQIPSSEVFDMDLLAKRYALGDILGARHGIIWHNNRFYFNPVTGLLEMIPFDENADPYFPDFTFDVNNFPGKKLFQEVDFVQRYNLYLSKYMEEYPDILEKYKHEIESAWLMIQRDDNDLTFSFSDIQTRIERINEMRKISPPVVITKFIGDYLSFEIINPNKQPILVTGFFSNGESLPVSFDFPIMLDSINGRKAGIQVNTRLPKSFANEKISMKFHGLFSDEELNFDIEEMQYSFYVAGHAYGAGTEVPDGLHGPLISYLETVTMDPKMEFGVFTGDFVQEDNDEQYAQFMDSVKKTGLPFYANPGNHDISKGGERFDRLVGPRFQAFDFQGSVFIFLDPTYPDQNIPPEQIRMIKDILGRNPKAENVFVFSHYLIWWEADDDRYNYISPNWDYGRTEHTNFQSEVLPLFKQFSGKTYFIAGDVGKTDDSRGIFFEEFDGFKYIASGMGNRTTDNVLEFQVYEDGRVFINLVSLKSGNRYWLGGIEKYRKNLTPFE